MPRIMLLKADGQTFEVDLYDNDSVADLIKSLPQTISMSRWGDEFYGALGARISSSGQKQEVFAVGEVALWPAGNALCVFFGPTPASRGSEPRMASPGIALGIINTNAQDFKKFGSSLSKVELSLKK